MKGIRLLPRSLGADFFWWLVWYLLSLLLSSNYYYKYVHSEDPAPALQTATTSSDSDKDVLGAVGKLWGENWIDHGYRGLYFLALNSEPTLPGDHSAAPERSIVPERQVPDAPLSRQIKQVQDTLERRLHPEQPLPDAFLKIATVVALSFLSFYTFVFADGAGHRYALSKNGTAQSPRERASPREPPDTVCAKIGVWACLLGRAIRGLYRHPVKLAFVAFSLLPALPFVIGMHHAYEPAVFVMALAAIFVAAEHYSGLKTTEHELKERTDHLQRSMETVLDADGLNQWRADLYRLYGNAKKRVDAVYRHFDIDMEWWLSEQPDKPYWDHYVEQAIRNEESLWFTLCKSESRVQFIFDAPLSRLPRKFRNDMTDLEKATFFRFLLGLVWNLVVFEQVYRKRLEEWNAGKTKKACPLRVKLTRAPFWMHVADDTVFQLIERGETVSSTARELTSGVADAGRRKSLSDWARENVREAAQRGGRAEEYVCTLLRYTGFAQGCVEDSVLQVGEILKVLGMDEWLKLPKEEFVVADFPDKAVRDQRQNRVIVLTTQQASSLCINVFEMFLDLYLPAKPGEATGQTRPWILSDLVSQVS